MHVLLIPSANDAANVLACHISGSVENFSELMNSKAKELGATHTHFVNPSGIHNDDHYTTARDMSLIGKYAYSLDTIREIASNTEYELPPLEDGTERKFKTTNTLITKDHSAYYEYATGLKTGYTDKAQSCIVSTAKKDDMELMCVVLGGQKITYNTSYRDIDCHTLFDYGFNNFKYTTVCEKNNNLDLSLEQNVPDILKESNIAFSDDISLLANTNNKITHTIDWNDNLKLPIEKKSVVGTITYTIDGTNYAVNLVAKDNIYPVGGSTITYAFYALIIFLIVIIFINFLKHKHKNKYHRKPRSSDDDRLFRRSLY